jgi:hypothetical protein
VNSGGDSIYNRRGNISVRGSSKCCTVISIHFGSPNNLWYVVIVELEMISIMVRNQLST